ncbi:RRQRL motif-containing zinc-binding protein [Streptomyces sp. NRRL F-5123]|uniref:RRQRL motif-containing zinc-binding protein n=1 Tax=Streptomyces sp. NRRL F-5123 TaxID=1463856 RepID=UPI0007C4F3CE|nr:RRQRL motif-containing zinc-binding protein [Streptomyces sp. NRRL F-5123]
MTAATAAARGGTHDAAGGPGDVSHGDDQPPGLPTYDWNTAPRHLLATRRQLRARGLRPGGQNPVAQLRCKDCTGLTRDCGRMAWLYQVALALPVRQMTLAKEVALDRAMAARQTCPKCRRRFIACLPLRTLGSCLECYDGTPVDPRLVMFPAPQPDPAAADTATLPRRDVAA